MKGRDATHLPLGACCILVGLAAIGLARDYPYGTVTAMGPGFIPTAVSILLIGFGCLILALRGADVDVDESAPVDGGEAPTSHALIASAARAMVCVVGAIVTFGLAVQPLGLAISTFLIVMIGGAGHPKARALPLLALAAGLSAASCIGFVLLLGLEIPIWPRVS